MREMKSLFRELGTLFNVNRTSGPGRPSTTRHNYTGRENLTEHEKRTLMTDNTEKLGGDAMDARAYEVLEKEFQEVR